MRLDKALTFFGLTRTEAHKAIAAGRVSVNGRLLTDAAAQVEADAVRLDGSPSPAPEELYIMMNKPAGFITATQDKKLPVVTELLPDIYRRRKIGPVGRLDRDVTGLVILTTDGQLAHRLMSPRHKAEKRYRAVCEGRLQSIDRAIFASGIELSDFTAKPARLEILSASEERSEADVILTEGKFHEVKRMFIAIGHPLISLKRLSVGGVELDEHLELGQCRLLTDEEIETLRRSCE